MKRKHRVSILVGLVLLFTWSVLLPRDAGARQTTITSPSQLIDVVNILRVYKGLSPLIVHSALMQSVQSLADYMASTGQITYSRPGGIIFTRQLISLGFPPADIPTANVSASSLLIGIFIIAALVGGGVAVWLIRDLNG